jgi:hypothetical protein
MQCIQTAVTQSCKVRIFFSSPQCPDRLWGIGIAGYIAFWWHSRKGRNWFGGWGEIEYSKETEKFVFTGE